MTSSGRVGTSCSGFIARSFRTFIGDGIGRTLQRLSSKLVDKGKISAFWGRYWAHLLLGKPITILTNSHYIKREGGCSRALMTMYALSYCRKFNIGATYMADVGPGELTLNANFAHTSSQATHPTDVGDSAYQLPAIDLVNARIRYEPNDMPVTISLFANNLLDNTYASYATRFGGGYWDRGGPTRIQIPLSAPERSALFVVRGKPREVGLTLQYDF